MSQPGQTHGVSGNKTPDPLLSRWTDTLTTRPVVQGKKCQSSALLIDCTPVIVLLIIVFGNRVFRAAKFEEKSRILTKCHLVSRKLIGLMRTVNILGGHCSKKAKHQKGIVSADLPVSWKHRGCLASFVHFFHSSHLSAYAVSVTTVPTHGNSDLLLGKKSPDKRRLYQANQTACIYGPCRCQDGFGSHMITLMAQC